MGFAGRNTCVVLLITYLVTSADSAVLVINTIVSGGAPDGVRARHIVLWSVLLGLVIITFYLRAEWTPCARS